MEAWIVKLEICNNDNHFIYMDRANEIKMYSLDNYSYVNHIVVPNIDISK